ncbi:hypothetical protein KUCAC02_036684 [Chaenocephalus aceratus]|nr:hypothetical protein KUCAC02_036684 [Chaenocephalus aceratus]
MEGAVDSYTPGKENLGESSSDLKIRLKLCSRTNPTFYTLCKKNRPPPGRGGAGRPQRPRPLRGGGGGASHLQPMREAFQPRLQLARHQLTHRGGAASPATRRLTWRSSSAKQREAQALEEQRHKKAHLEEQRHKKAHLEEQRHKKAHLEEQRRRKRPALDETAPLESDSE